MLFSTSESIACLPASISEACGSNFNKSHASHPWPWLGPPLAVWLLCDMLCNSIFLTCHSPTVGDMVTGRIAAEHRSFNRIREVTPIWTHLTHGFLDSQTESRSFQSFCVAHGRDQHPDTDHATPSVAMGRRAAAPTHAMRLRLYNAVVVMIRNNMLAIDATTFLRFLIYFTFFNVSNV